MAKDSHDMRLMADIPESSNTKDEGQVVRHPALIRLTPEQHETLRSYLVTRLKLGMNRRHEMLERYKTVDRVISTWQLHDASDSKRLAIEDATGRQTAVKENLPILATHLEDLVAFYADTLSPIGNPLISSTGSKEIQDLTLRITKDITVHGYYTQVAMACRALLKYNIGGTHVEWEQAAPNRVSLGAAQSQGSNTKAIDPYNTFWDTAVREPDRISSEAEWAAVVEPISRVQLLRHGLSGQWFGVEKVIASTQAAGSNGTTGATDRFWVDPSAMIPSSDGTNTRTGSDAGNTPDWSQYGLSLSTDGGHQDEVTETYERVIVYAWVNPYTLGLLRIEDTDAIIEKAPDFDIESYIELWRFVIINGTHIVMATPRLDREKYLMGEAAIIPIFMSHLIRDQMGTSQRSTMELVIPFQRFASSLYAMGVDAARSATYGLKGIDGSMFNRSDVEGVAAGVVVSKIPGRDVRTGIASLDVNSGANTAFEQVERSLALKNTLFPSQALPAQVAGLDRAVTNQVSAVVHGAQRGLRMLLRQLDASVFMRTRIEFVRNLTRFESMTTGEVSDEEIAKSLGSGIESLEAERITEALWRLLMAIIQNQEAMQVFDVPAIMIYLGQTLRIDADMSSFVRQQPQQPPPAEGGPAGPEGQMSQEEAMMAAAQAGA